MILLIVLVATVAGVAIWAGVPWPLAIVAGIALPLVGSTLYLRVSHQDAPTGTLTPNDPRTRRFLALLSERYRAQGYEHGAVALQEALCDYDSGQVGQASARLATLSSAVAHSPSSTMLISIWQRAWRDAGSGSGVGVQPVRPAQTRPDDATRPSTDGHVDRRSPPAFEGPWAAQNAERDAGLFLRAVLYSLLSHDAPASSKAYATAIGQSVTEGNEKTLLVLLSAVTYFIGKVHFLRDDPTADPAYLPYSRLLAAHFMNGATQCLPGPNAPREDVRTANASRMAADMSEASVAVVEALGIVGSSAAAGASPR